MKSEENKQDQRKALKTTADDFLLDLLRTSSPSGYEFEAQKVIEKYITPVAESVKKFRQLIQRVLHVS